MTPRVIISNNFSDQTYKNVTHSDMIIYDKIIKELNESKAIFKDNSIQPKIDSSNQSNKTFKSRVTTELLNKAFRYHVIPT